uniref:Gustatory receptor n=2 Tax=Culex quinquefasciatus TaxID=7176 RepID=A0A1S4JNG6_CULQU
MVRLDSLEDILRICNWLAHSAVYFDKKTNRYRTLKTYSVVILANAAFLTVLTGVYTWRNLQIPADGYAGYGKMFTLLIVIDSELSFFWCYSMILNGVRQKKNTLKLFNLMSAIRQTGQETIRYRVRLFIVLNIALNLIFTYGISVLRLDFSKDLYLVGFNLMFCVFSTINDMYLILFNTLVVRIRAELTIASERIAESIRNGRDIRLQAQHYFRILQLPHLLTKSLGLPVLFFIALSFFEGTIQTLQMYQLLGSSLGRSSLGEILGEVVNYAVWYLPFMVKLLVTMQLAHSATQQANEAALSTRHFDDYSMKNTKLAKQINKFLLKNLHQKKKFSAFGFFNIDNSVIYTVFSSIITYLVILIQFKQLENDLTHGNSGNETISAAGGST